MEQIPDLPCPCCGSICTLGSLRKKREEVRARLEAQKRKPEPIPTPSDGLHTHTTNSSFGGYSTAMNPNAVTLSPGNNGVAWNASSSTITIRAPDPNTLVGGIEINGAVLDVCIECGTFYSPNAKRLGEEILDETHRLDPLGALAEIRNTEAAPLG